MLDLLEAPASYPGVPTVSMRRCSRCGELKPVDDFPIKNKATGLRRVWCRLCCRASGKEHYQRERSSYLDRARRRRHTERPRISVLIDEYLRAHPCIDCGCSDITVLEFDHRDSSLKIETVGRLKAGAIVSTVMREIEKCDVRCANCHRRRTAAQFGWLKKKGLVLAQDVPRPGTTGRYAAIRAARQDPLFAASPYGLRRCSRCRALKPLAEYAFRDIARGERDYYCRPCRRAYRRGHYERNRADYISRALMEMRMKREDTLVLVWEYLRQHPCVDCGETDILALEFDHVDPETKTRDVAYMIGRRNWQTILAEIQKCVVRCANCHRRRTAQQQGWKVRLGEAIGRYVRLDVARE